MFWGGADYYPSFDEHLYERAFNEFENDYKRWYPEDNVIDDRKILLTPQLLVVLMYRLAHDCFLLPENNCLRQDADVLCLGWQGNWANGNIL